MPFATSFPTSSFNVFLHQVTVKEPQTPGDSTAIVLLTVSRSEGGRGAVKLLWILEEAARYDLIPLNGTLYFNEVFLILQYVIYY